MSTTIDESSGGVTGKPKLDIQKSKSFILTGLAIIFTCGNVCPILKALFDNAIIITL